MVIAAINSYESVLVKIISKLHTVLTLKEETIIQRGASGQVINTHSSLFCLFGLKTISDKNSSFRRSYEKITTAVHCPTQIYQIDKSLHVNGRIYYNMSVIDMYHNSYCATRYYLISPSILSAWIVLLNMSWLDIWH